MTFLWQWIGSLALPLPTVFWKLFKIRTHVGQWTVIQIVKSFLFVQIISFRLLQLNAQPCDLCDDKQVVCSYFSFYLAMKRFLFFLSPTAASFSDMFICLLWDLCDDKNVLPLFALCLVSISYLCLFVLLLLLFLCQGLQVCLHRHPQETFLLMLSSKFKRSSTIFWMPYLSSYFEIFQWIWQDKMQMNKCTKNAKQMFIFLASLLP